MIAFMNTLKETGINLKYGDCHKYDRSGVKDYICCGAVIYNKKYIYTVFVPHPGFWHRTPQTLGMS